MGYKKTEFEVRKEFHFHMESCQQLNCLIKLLLILKCFTNLSDTVLCVSLKFDTGDE